jgi:UPF0716 family protein affecting phage T7 exclusion
LLTPALLTDSLGFSLLVPAGRKVFKAVVSKAIADRMGGRKPMTIDGQWAREE